MTKTSAPPPQAINRAITNWDRAAVILLGFAGCALSYDALQQMAEAIHVRSFLTYLFPLVIDGFIAYGVRALLVLAEAPMGARVYVWSLFSIATAASIWANALHAVRLNQLQRGHGGLQLGDFVVAILSTLAPLALAGAVHLYIIITRHHPHTASGTGTKTKQTTGAGKRGPVPAADLQDGGARRTRWLHPVPDLPSTSEPGTDPASPTGTGDRRAGTGDRPTDQGTGDHQSPAQHTVPATTGDRGPVPQTHRGQAASGTGPRTAGTAASPAAGDRAPAAGTGDRGPVPENTASRPGDRSPHPPSPRRVQGTAPIPGKASRPVPGPVPAPGPRDGEDTVPGTGSADEHIPPAPGTGSQTGRPRDAAGDGGGTTPPPGTVPKQDGPRTAHAAKTGPRSRASQHQRQKKGTVPKLSDEQILAKVRPHVPALLARDRNAAISRVQLREILRTQNIAVRNERLTPILDRLRNEAKAPTTSRSTAR